MSRGTKGRIGAAVLLAAGVIAGPPVVAAGTPRIEVPVEEIDLGRVNRGEVAEARFVLRNVGDGELRIEEPDPG